MRKVCERPLVVRCGAFGDMVLVTALIRDLSARFARNVDIVTSGPWSEPLLHGQPGVGDIFSVRSRKTPYWLSADQQRVVRRLKARGWAPPGSAMATRRRGRCLRAREYPSDTSWT